MQFYRFSNSNCKISALNFTLSRKTSSTSLINKERRNPEFSGIKECTEFPRRRNTSEWNFYLQVAVGASERAKDGIVCCLVLDIGGELRVEN